MDDRRFDNVTRRLAGRTDDRITRRSALVAASGGLLAAFGLRRGIEAQVYQSRCGNRTC